MKKHFRLRTSILIAFLMLASVFMAAADTSTDGFWRALGDGGGFPTSTPTVTLFPTSTPFPTLTPFPTVTTSVLLATQEEPSLFVEDLFASPTPIPQAGSTGLPIWISICFGLGLLGVLILLIYYFRRQGQRA